MDLSNLALCSRHRRFGLRIHGALLPHGMRSRALVCLILLVGQMQSFAQCAMCKASAEAAQKEGDTIADGLNVGILYLMAFPYLTLAVIAILWYRHNKKRQAKD